MTTLRLKHRELLNAQSLMLSRRLLCTQVSTGNTTTTISIDNPKKWKIKQVTKSNFSELLEEIKTQILDSDFIAISIQKTGSYSAPWQRVLPFDTADIAYLKAKYAAERFQVLQFALCPFRLKGSTLTAFPYNFHLFPRDTLKNGMPSYSFSCQMSYMESMARVGFDFNECIYNGISYLSRAQESLSKHHLGIPVLAKHAMLSSPPSSVADSLFLKRIQSRIRKWRDACKDSSSMSEDVLLKSLRNIVSGSEQYGSRPSIDLDICSEHQAQLVLEVLKEFPDDLVPLLVPSKRGSTQALRVVFTSSKEDKCIFEAEIKDLVERQNKRVRGFREVIDLISASQKPVIAHNSLDDFTFIYSKFLGPLPPTADGFNCSLKSVFPCVLDLNHIMKEINPQKRLNNIPAALSYIRYRFFAPINLEIPHQGFSVELNESKVHGHNVLRISQLFAKLCFVLKQGPEDVQQTSNSQVILERYANVFSPCPTSYLEHSYNDVRVSSCNIKKLSSEDLVFLWGFRSGLSAGGLKRWLTGTHSLFGAEEFDVRLVDKRTAVVAFWQPGVATSFLEVMDNGGDQVLRNVMSEGVRVGNYGTYKEVCGMSIWESNLADSMDKALRSTESSLVDDKKRTAFEIYWDKETAVNLDDL